MLSHLSLWSSMGYVPYGGCEVGLISSAFEALWSLYSKCFAVCQKASALSSKGLLITSKVAVSCSDHLLNLS